MNIKNAFEDDFSLTINFIFFIFAVSALYGYRNEQPH